MAGSPQEKKRTTRARRAPPSDRAVAEAGAGRIPPAPAPGPVAEIEEDVRAAPAADADPTPPQAPAPAARPPSLLGTMRGAWARRFGNAPDPEPDAGPEAPTESSAEPPPPRRGAPRGPLQLADEETKDLLRRVRRQQSLRLRQDLQEAKELERRGRELERQVRARQRARQEALRHTEHVRGLAPELGLDPDRPITVVPPPDEGAQQVEFTTVQEGRSYVRITYQPAANAYRYEVIEPVLSATEEEVLAFLRDTLVRTLDGRGAAPVAGEEGEDGEGEDWESFLLEAAQRAIVDHSILIDEVGAQRVQYYLVRDFLGYGPIDVLMRDPMIEDISCDGPHIPVYLFHREYESLPTNVTFTGERTLDSFVVRLAQRSGKHISLAEPLLDATLPDKSRLQASLSREVTTRGSSFTIRKFRGDPLTPPDLVRLGTFSAEMAAYLWMAMEEGSSLVYAGGTASGKTTTLNAASLFIPPHKKIVSIEDTREINLPHANWIAGLTRTGFGGEVVGGKVTGTIDMYRLLEAALRQRPEYLLVGEVRGPEALTLFQAMATGHATYSTLHADSVMSAVYRLENPPIGVPRIMLQTLDAFAVQVLARVNHRAVRRIKEVVEIVGVDPESGDLLTNTVFQWDSATDSHRFLGKSRVLDAIAEKNNLAPSMAHDELRRRQRLVEWMVERGVRRIQDVAGVVGAYYATPEALLARIDEPAAKRHGRSRPPASARTPETPEVTE